MCIDFNVELKSEIGHQDLAIGPSCLPRGPLGLLAVIVWSHNTAI